MENGRNWQGGAALLLAGLALVVALSGRVNFNFSVSDGNTNTSASTQAFRIEQGAIAPGDIQSMQDEASRLQALQEENNQLRQQLGQKGQPIAPPVPVMPAAPQAPQLRLQTPDAPQLWQGGHTERHFGPFGGGFNGFGGGPFSMPARLLPLIGLGLLAWFFFFRRRRWAHGQQQGGPQGGQQGGSSGGESARRATTPLQPPTPPEGPTGGQS